MRQGHGLRVVALLIALVATARAEDADSLFSDARAAEDSEHDPARALAIYERILHDYPDASVAIAAERRATQLRAVVGAHGEHAREAAAWSALVAGADQQPIDEVVTRADALAHAAWPGADDAAVWLASWLCRHGRRADAQARFARLIAASPAAAGSAPPAAAGSAPPAAARAAAACALDAGDWDLADTLADRMPTTDLADRASRDELHAQAARGRLRARLYTASWITLALAFAALLASLADAIFRSGRRAPSARPPIEVLFLAPVAAILVLAAYTAHKSIGPAVLRISLVGVALAYLSGTTLDLLRTRGRPVRARALLHILACALGVLAIGYIALTHDGLIDLLAETVRFGPDA